MISELKDDEILDLLMTSDFVGDYKPEELKYLLIKWRYFYRLLIGKYDLCKVDHDGLLKNLKDDLYSKDSKINRLLIENSELKNTISQIENRKLSWKERISGKIINIKDENK
jgi:hypothetical protein